MHASARTIELFIFRPFRSGAGQHARSLLNADKYMSTDVLLINPPYRICPPFTYDHYEQIDLPRNLGIIGAWLERAGISVGILESTIEEMSFEDIEAEIRSRRPKVVGITNRSTSTYPMVEKTAQIVKAIDHRVPVIVGGTYVSWLPEEAMQKCTAVDYVTVGEADVSAPELVRRLLAGEDPTTVRGIAYRDPDDPATILRTPSALLIENLDDVPVPAYHLVPISKYVKRKERYLLSFTRGCLFRCEYCTSSYERGRIRFHSVDRIVQEFSLAYEYGFKYFYFYDDIFTADRNRVLDLCRNIVNSGMRFSWHCLARTEFVDADLLRAMREAGCDRIAYGVESASASSLASFRRKARKTKEAFDMTRAAGIRSIAFAVFGFPGESFADQLATIRMLQQLRPGMVRDFTYKPYPGTPQYANPEAYGIQITNRNYVRWSQQDEPVHRTRDLSEEEIIEARLFCSYVFRSSGNFPQGEIFRKRQKIVMIRTGEGAIIYNAYVNDEKRKVDLYLNCIRVNQIYFEVLLHCDGYHTIEMISEIVDKLFELGMCQSQKLVRRVIADAQAREIVEPMPLSLSSYFDEVVEGSEAATTFLMPAEDYALSAKVGGSPQADLVRPDTGAAAR